MNLFKKGLNLALLLGLMTPIYSAKEGEQSSQKSWLSTLRSKIKRNLPSKKAAGVIATGLALGAAAIYGYNKNAKFKGYVAKFTGGLTNFAKNQKQNFSNLSTAKKIAIGSALALTALGGYKLFQKLKEKPKDLKSRLKSIKEIIKTELEAKDITLGDGSLLNLELAEPWAIVSQLIERDQLNVLTEPTKNELKELITLHKNEVWQDLNVYILETYGEHLRLQSDIENLKALLKIAEDNPILLLDYQHQRELLSRYNTENYDIDSLVNIHTQFRDIIALTAECPIDIMVDILVASQEIIDQI